MKVYYCSLSKTKLCKYGGNKGYNYGFVSGSAGYCYYKKRWVSDMQLCPLSSPNKPLHVDRQGRLSETNDKS